MSNRMLLHSADDLCDAYYHVKDTPEASVAQHCLRARGCCSGKTTCLVAQLLAPDGTEAFLRLYRNEAQSSCAEGFLQRDEALLRRVEELDAASRGAGGATLSLYLTQQPCHYSSSNDTNSCTENLLGWYRQWMVPRGVAHLRIRAAYPYRSHWDEAHMSEDDLAGLGRRKWSQGGKGGKGGKGGCGKGGGGKGGGGPSDRQEAIERARQLLRHAREGTHRLVNQAAAGVTLESFSEADWQFILGVCSDELRASYAAGAPPFSPDVRAKRATLDAFTKRIFDAHRESGEPPPSHGASPSQGPPRPAGEPL